MTTAPDPEPINTTSRSVAESARVERLYPDPGPTTITEELLRYRPWEETGDDRAWVAANMITTLDGRAALDGRTVQLGSPADQEMLGGLRTRFDAVMVGAGTIRAERYDRIFRDPNRRSAREQVGMEGDPLVVIVSGSLNLPWDAPIFTNGGGRVLIFTTRDAGEAPETATPLIIETMPDGLDPAAMVKLLHRKHGVRALICEGGPTLLGQLTDADLLDELFLTVSPLVAGSEALRIAERNQETRQFELHRVLLGDGELMTSYRRRD